jgi:hypothetical protein
VSATDGPTTDLPEDVTAADVATDEPATGTPEDGTSTGAV